ncbi:MAG: DMT family transporter [Bacteroidetes bacterium]|nr:DMT family transporter [Bacteroidota bacterium]
MNIRKGILYMLMATFFFALMNVCVKQISHIPPMEAVFFRCFISMLFCFGIIFYDNLDWRGSDRWRLIARGVAGTTAVYTFFVTLQKLPLAPAVTIQYTSPIFTTLIAVFVLKERMRPIQYLFFIMSFAGVLLIKGFGGRISIAYLLLGLFSALMSAVAYNLVRSLKEREHPIVVVLHFQIVGTVIGLAGCLFDWRMPQGMDWFYLFATGLLTQLGQTNLTKALQSERVAITSSLNYLGILYALIFGVMFFGESYTVTIMTGILLVVAGVVLNIIFGKKEETPPALDE